MIFTSVIHTNCVCHVLLNSTITLLSIEALIDFSVLQGMPLGQCDLSVPSLYVASVGNLLCI